ncbi:retrovirus-related pol polyprotein from transposon TNT 1-94, partial [Tanacetum coccineum]
KQLKTVNGTEFRNSELKSFCNEKGISQNFSSPYTPEQNGVAERKNRTLIEAARTMMNGSVLFKHFWTEASIEAIRFTNTLVDEIKIDDSSRYPPDEFLQEDDPSRQYQSKYDISYYIIHHETQEQVVQDEQINRQPTKDALGNITETSVPITETLIPKSHQSQDTNYASTSSYPVAQDRWSRDQHIELVNIIGDPGEGMLTRSMAAKLTTASASECLFADFLSKIEPKKVTEALKHPGWVDAMHEELNQFYIFKV